VESKDLDAKIDRVKNNIYCLKSNNHKEIDTVKDILYTKILVIRQILTTILIKKLSSIISYSLFVHCYYGSFYRYFDFSVSD
jgi:hypothetical protein